MGGAAIITARTSHSKKHDITNLVLLSFSFDFWKNGHAYEEIYVRAHVFFSGRCDMGREHHADAASTTSTTHSKSCHYRRSFRLTDLDLDGSRGLQKGERAVLGVVAPRGQHWKDNHCLEVLSGIVL